ncbi:hypothetical protein NQ176_g7272 [Zarea fungicola]|uniref:Uncharacterized protein n=1 Tax=Zarea fungicola TaxID=93591 RepID=A0ACC1N0C7_9HYPO|nr:hypothetical protein NQ176_g7272 [Lecanicillium fungicola]
MVQVTLTNSAAVAALYVAGFANTATGPNAGSVLTTYKDNQCKVVGGGPNGLGTACQHWGGVPVGGSYMLTNVFTANCPNVALLWHTDKDCKGDTGVTIQHVQASRCYTDIVPSAAPSKPQHSKDAKKFSSPYQTSKDAEQPAQTEFIFFDFTIKMSRWEEPAEHRPDLDLYLQPYRDNIDQAMAAKDWDVALRNIDIVLPMLVLNDQRPHCRAGAFTPTELVETIGQHGLPDQLLLVLFHIGEHEDAAEWFWQYGKIRAFFESAGETELGRGVVTLGHHPQHERTIDYHKVLVIENLREENYDRAVEQLRALYNVGPLWRNPGCLWCKLRALPIYRMMAEKARRAVLWRNFNSAMDWYDTLKEVLVTVGEAELQNH